MWLHANFGSDRSGCLCIPKHWSHQMIVILHVKTLCLQEDVRLTSRDVTRHWQSVSDQSNTLQNKPSLVFDSSTQNLPVVEVPLRAWDTNKSRICLTGSTATRLKQAFLFPSILVTCAGEALHRLHLFSAQAACQLVLILWSGGKSFLQPGWQEHSNLTPSSYLGKIF